MPEKNIIENSNKKAAENELINKIRTWGAVLMFLCLASFFIPGLNIVVFVAAPLLVALLVWHYGYLNAIISTVILVVVAYFSPIKAIWPFWIIVLQYCLLGFLLGYGFKKEWSGGKNLMWAFIFMIATTLIIAGADSLFNLGFWQSYHSSQIQTINSAINEIVATYEKNDFLKSTGLTVDEFLVMWKDAANSLIFAVYIVGIIFQTWLSYIIIAAIMRRIGASIRRFPVASEWRLPAFFSWFAIIALIFYLLDYLGYIGWGEVIALNMFYIMLPFLLVVGFSLWLWLWRISTGMFTRFTMILLLVWLPQIIILALMILAIFDPLVDFRKLWIDLWRKSIEKNKDDDSK